MQRIDSLFKCPQCGEDDLEEIQINVTVASEIWHIADGGDVQYGEQTNEDGETDRFQCMGCGWTVPNAKSIEDLYDLLISPDSPCKPDTH